LTIIAVIVETQYRRRCRVKGYDQYPYWYGHDLQRQNHVL